MNQLFELSLSSTPCLNNLLSYFSELPPVCCLSPQLPLEFPLLWATSLSFHWSALSLSTAFSFFELGTSLLFFEQTLLWTALWAAFL